MKKTKEDYRHIPDTLLDPKVIEEMEDREAKIVAFVIYGLIISFFAGFSCGVLLIKFFK